MRPAFQFNDSINVSLCNPKLFGETVCPTSINTFFVRGSDFVNTVYAKLCHAVRYAFGLSLLAVSVFHVVRRIAQKQMGCPTALRVIAFVKNQQSIWNRSYKILVGNSMSIHGFLRYTRNSVAAWVCRTSPYPTAPEFRESFRDRSISENLCPEFIWRHFWSTHMTAA